MWKGPSFTPFNDTYDVQFSHWGPAGTSVLYCTLVPSPRCNVPVCLSVNPSLPVESPNLFCSPDRNGNIKLILSCLIPGLLKQGNWFGTATSKLEIMKLLTAIQTRKKGKSSSPVKRNVGTFSYASAAKNPKLSFELKGISPFRRKMNVLESQTTVVSTAGSNQQQQSQQSLPVQQQPLQTIIHESPAPNQTQSKVVTTPAVAIQSTETKDRPKESGANQQQQHARRPVQQRSLKKMPSSDKKVLQKSHEPADSGRPVEPGGDNQQIVSPTPVQQEVPSSGRFLQKFLLTSDQPQPTAVQRQQAVVMSSHTSNFPNPITSNSSTLPKPILQTSPAANQTQLTAVCKLPVIGTMPSPVQSTSSTSPYPMQYFKSGLVLPDPVPCTDVSVPPPQLPPDLSSRHFHLSGSIPAVPVSTQNLPGPDPSLAFFQPAFRPDTTTNGSALIQLTGNGKAAVNTRALLPRPRPATYCRTCTFDSLQAANNAFTGKML